MLLATIAATATEAGKFKVPMTSPEAEWHREGVFAGTGVMGYLDGPRKEVFACCGPSIETWFEWGGEFVLRKYYPEMERYITISGGACGYMDGPLSRARFAGWTYGSGGPRGARSTDGKMLFFTEPKMGTVVRVIDFEKKEVRTIAKVKGIIAMTADEKGNLWTVGWGNRCVVLDPTGKKIKEMRLSNELPSTYKGKPFPYAKQPLVGHGFCTVYDTVRKVLWGFKRNGLYLWYWDLNNGGRVVPVLWDWGKQSRGMCVTGPFDGTKMHCPGGIRFGPDDPEHRFLYMGGGDDTTFYRLDLEKREWVMFGPPPEEEQRAKKEHRRLFEVLKFVHHKGKFPWASIAKWCGPPAIDEDGNIYLGIALSGTIVRFKRVK